MQDSFKTIIEPFRIKSVEPLTISSRKDREKWIEEACYNPFLLRADQVTIDFLTDSGTGAMSAQQWAAMMQGDESYAGAKSWLRLEEELRDLTGMPHVLPTHQGRAAERILYARLGGPGKYFFSNTHFDTTRANIEVSGATAIDLPASTPDPDAPEYAFQGNLDTRALRRKIQEVGAANVGAVILTVTNNSGGGQPVSFANAKEVSAICKQNGIMMVLDCCRIAENAYFIRHFEAGHAPREYREIAQMMFALADGAIMSAKKDGMVNMGGFLAVRDHGLAQECGQMLIITEGYTSYGGLTGRDMEALAVGLREVFQHDYLEYRIRSTAYLADGLAKIGVPVQLPAGGHAVYIDARAMYPHIPVAEYPGQALVVDLYRLGGIRSVEVGSVMFGKYDEAGKLIPAPRDLVRLAIPRRVYTQSHIDYVIEAFDHVMSGRSSSGGYQITWEPTFLRHFTSKFAPLPVKALS